MDCKVETTEDLDSILQFVTNPDEGIVEFPDHDQEDHFRILVDTKLEAIEALVAEERDFIRGIDDVNENQNKDEFELKLNPCSVWPPVCGQVCVSGGIVTRPSN